MKKILLIIIAILFNIINTKSQNPDCVWARNAAGDASDFAVATATDSNGNIYVAGYFYSPTLTLGTTVLTNNSSPGATDIFVAKLDPSGVLLWARSAGGTDIDEPVSLAVDAAGNCIVTGFYYSTTITLGTTVITNNSNTGHCDIFVIKYDTSGNLAWAEGFGANVDEGAKAVTTDSNNNIFIAGDFASAQLIFGIDTLMNTNVIYNDIFLVKLDASGGAIWANAPIGIFDDHAFGLTTDSDDNIAMTGGYSSEPFIFGIDTLHNATGNGYADMFVVKYSNNGTELWARSIGGSGIDAGTAITTDASDNFIATGYYESPTITFGSTTLTNMGAGYSDAMTVKYSTNGIEQWAESIGDIGVDRAWAVCTDPGDNVFVTGWYSSTSMTIGSTTLTNLGIDDMYIMKYNSAGGIMWAQSAGGLHSDKGYGIASDNSGNIYVAGSSQSFLVTFNTISYTNSDGQPNTFGYDAFLAKYSPSTIGVNEINNEQTSYTISPNPFSMQTTVSFNEIQTSTTLKITDIVGREIYQKEIAAGTKNIILEKGKMKAGVYFVKIGKENKKIIIE